VRARDPYTAGHQERVADLAAAMAVEMGLGAQQIEGNLISALVHVIDKFAIPSEILTTPSALPLDHNVDRCTGPGGGSHQGESFGRCAGGRAHIEKLRQGR
jgi:hypothetical protein